MKKAYIFIIIISVAVLAGFFLLNKNKDEDIPPGPIPGPPTDEYPRDTLEETDSFMASFMEARLDKDYVLAQGFLSEKAKSQYSTPPLTLIATSSPYFFDFGVMEKQQTSPQQSRYVLRIFEGEEEKIIGYFDETLIVDKQDHSYIIFSVERSEYIDTRPK